MENQQLRIVNFVYSQSFDSRHECLTRSFRYQPLAIQMQRIHQQVVPKQKNTHERVNVTDELPSQHANQPWGGSSSITFTLSYLVYYVGAPCHWTRLRLHACEKLYPE